MNSSQTINPSPLKRNLPGWVGWLSPIQFSRLITFTQAMADAIVVFITYMLSYLLYTVGLQKISPQTAQEFILFSAAAAIVYVIILDRAGLYRREISLLNIKELRGIFRTALYAGALILTLTFYWRSVTFSRLTLTFALIASPIALYVQRQIFYRFHMLFHQQGWSLQPVLIYGAGQIGTHLARRMFESPSLGVLPVGFLDDESIKHGKQVKWTGIGPKEGLPTLGGEEWLERANRLGIHQIFIALPSATFVRNQQLVDACVKRGLKYAIVPNTYEKFIQNIELFEIGGIPILRRRDVSISFFYLAFKTVLDFFLSILLMIIFSPFWIAFSILIKLDSPGPVLFKQKRVGLRGREFSFYKFRTMHVDSPQYAMTPSNPTDPRITRVGRWLRRTSLDELPQIYNVLRGDMSLVGPRPEMPFIVASYTALEKRRLEAKPGITGVWQISAVRGEPIHANIEFDLFYLENRSLLLDFAILIKTIFSVIRGVGAV